MAQTNDGGNISRKGSGGPRTKRGKRRSSLNALKHGLRSRRPEAMGIATAAFRAWRWRLERRWAPSSEAERFLVRRFADISWRLMACADEEVRIFNGALEGHEGPGGLARVFLEKESANAIDQMVRRETTLNREMDRLIATLTGLSGRAAAAHGQRREIEFCQTNSGPEEPANPLRERAGGDPGGRDSRSLATPGAARRKS
jgi:hypothetical protein